MPKNGVSESYSLVMCMLQVGKHADLKLQQHSELRTSRTDHFHKRCRKNRLLSRRAYSTTSTASPAASSKHDVDAAKTTHPDRDNRTK